MTNNKIPNLFIIGAPKSGTTALAEYLGSHNNIFVTTPKEPHYFATDLDDYCVVKTDKEYKSLFTKTTGLEKVLSEASVYYMYSEVAIANMAKYCPDAKLIAMLRNPVDMVYSMHSQLLQSANENILSFKEAWASVPDRQSGNKIPPGCKCSKVLDYHNIAKYAHQLKRVYDHYPKNQVQIVLFDDFIENPLSTYKEALRFLDIPYDERHYFPVVNSNTRPRSYFIDSFIKKQNPSVMLAKNLLKKLIGKSQLGLLEKLDSINTLPHKRLPLEDTLRREIISVYQDDIAELQSLLAIDLSNWDHGVI